LLKRLWLTEGGYRKKFKSSKLGVDETSEQFIERCYLQKWTVKKAENNPEPSETDNELNDDTSRQSFITTETNTTEITSAAVQTRSVSIIEEKQNYSKSKDQESWKASREMEKYRRLTEEELATVQMRNDDTITEYSN